MESSIFKFKKEASFSCTKKYNQFLNWVSGEFDLFLQDETNGLEVYFPEGSFKIKDSNEKENIVAHINLNSKVEKKGEDILAKIMSLHTLFLNINS